MNDHFSTPSRAAPQNFENENENNNDIDISSSELSNIIINIILVNAGVRPAFLLQPVNYKEATGKDRKTAFILNRLRHNFPELKYTEEYEIYQGIIISKQDYSDETISLSEMGRILGYPCYQDFESLDDFATPSRTEPQNLETKVSYIFDVNVEFTNGKTEQLMTNIGKNIEKLKEFKDFAKNAEYVLKNCDFQRIYDKVFGRNFAEARTQQNRNFAEARTQQNEIPAESETIKQVLRVYVDLHMTIPIEHIIDKIITKRTNEPLSKIYQTEILNCLYNMGFSMDFQEFYKYNMQYDNKVHIGILLGLLLHYKNDTILAFTPIQQFPNEEQKVYEIIEQLEKDLMHLFTITKIL